MRDEESSRFDAMLARGGYARDFPAPSPSSLEPPPKRKRRWRRIALAIVALFVALFLWLAITAPLSKSLQPVAAPSITLVSAEGDPIAQHGAIIHQPVIVSELPDHVPQAFVAIEDRRFYNHLGIDPWGIARAAWRNTLAGGVREGGSTITQQLAKVSFLSSDRTVARKGREVLIAFWLEGWLTKEEILSRYLSNVYFGDNVYGLRAAARHYFSRSPDDLTLAQATMLAGLVRAPSRLAPTINLKGARDRAKVVARAMARSEFITEAEARSMKPARLKVAPVRQLPTGTYFADWVMPRARDLAGAVYGEQEVQTTLETDLQRHAVRAISRAPLGGAQVALVAMRPNGEIVAMVGGKNYKNSPFNRATQARRQPGSTFKLFVYLAALRAGMDPEDVVEDEPLTIGDWSPKNSDGRYRGTINLRDAFTVSSNVAAVRLSERVGRDRVIRAARDLGIRSPLANEPSIALGTSGVTLLELTAAYAAVAGNRWPVEPHGLPPEEQSWFDSLMNRQRSFDEDATRAMLLDLLSSVVDHGTGRAAALSVPTFGKTGTTQDGRDAIFIGFAGDLVTGVWVGNDDNSPLKGVQGGGLPARIWRDFMSRAVSGAAPRAAPAPPSRPLPDDAAGELTIPIEGTGMEVGIELGNESVTFSTRPAPGDRPRAPVDVPVVTPGPPPKGEDPPPVDE
jgi:penicillin-binding protein 1A